MALKKPKHVTESCKFIKYLMKNNQQRNTERGCLAIKLAHLLLLNPGRSAVALTTLTELLCSSYIRRTRKNVTPTIW